jgi:LysR family transcriptional activator of nhaA
MAWINLHHLKYFLTIAEEGSISGASKKLLVGQPALSAQLKQFEENLSLRLFERIGKKMVITPEGEYVLKYAKAIKQLEDELISNLGHAKESGIKEIILGAQESVPKAIMAMAISAVRTIPSLRVKVLEGTGEELFELLVAGKIDLFLGNFKPLEERKELIYSLISKEKVSVCGAKDYLSLKRNFPHSLQGGKFVLPGFQNPIRHDFEKFMLEQGLQFDVMIEAQDTALLKELAVRGQGLVIMGEESAHSWIKSGRLFKIGTIPKLSEEYWLGMVKKKIDTDHQKKILKAIGV